MLAFKILLLFLNIFLFFLIAFFAGIETAIVSVNRIRLKFLAEAGLKKAQKLISLLEKSENLISMVLCGYNITIVLLTTIATYFFSLILPYRDFAPLVTTVIFTPLILILGEIVPKTYFRVHANKLLMKYVDLLAFFYYLLYPFQMVLSFISNVFLKPILGSVPEEDKKIISSRQDLEKLLKVSEEEGVLDEDVKDMIDSVFDFSEKMVREVMVPRVKIEALPLGISKDELLDKFIKTGHSRIPIYREKLDNIVGIANVQDLVNDFFSLKKVEDILREPLFVPETMKIDDVFKQLKKNKVHLAIVVDEYGGVAGIVTMEDLLEEIFGEIEDEFDNDEKDIFFHKDNVIVVKATIDLSMLEEILDFKLENLLKDGTDNQIDTLGGFLLYHFGDIPSQGDKIVIDKYMFEILESDPKKIDKVKITILSAPPKHLASNSTLKDENE